MPQYNFTPAGGVPDFYGPLMNAAAGSLVRMPDGTFAQSPAPRYMPAQSLDQIYRGIIDAGGQAGASPQQIRAVTINPDGTIAAGGQASGPPSVPMPPPVPFMASNGSLSASGGYGTGGTVDTVNALDGSRLGLGYGNGAYMPTPPAVSAINSATSPPAPPSLFGIQLPQIPSVPQLLADAGQGLGNAGNYVQQQVAAKAPGIAQNIGNALVPSIMKSLPARSAVIDGFLRQAVENNRRQVAASMPDAGKQIQTNNHGTQIIGQRLNGSPRGYTVSNDNWFNAVRGL